MQGTKAGTNAGEAIHPHVAPISWLRPPCNVVAGCTRAAVHVWTCIRRSLSTSPTVARARVPAFSAAIAGILATTVLDALAHPRWVLVPTCVVGTREVAIALHFLLALPLTAALAATARLVL